MIVLSDPDYMIKVPLTSKSSLSDSVSILFKRLTESDPEQVLGKVEATMKHFKEASNSHTVKKWVQLEGKANRFQSPFKENA